MIGNYSQTTCLIVGIPPDNSSSLTIIGHSRLTFINIRAVQCCRGNPFQSAAIINVLLRQFSKPVAVFRIFHEDRVANFNVRPQSPVDMAMLAVALVVDKTPEISKTSRVRAARFTLRHCLGISGPAPPVFCHHKRISGALFTCYNHLPRCRCHFGLPQIPADPNSCFHFSALGIFWGTPAASSPIKQLTYISLRIKSDSLG